MHVLRQQNLLFTEFSKNSLLEHADSTEFNGKHLWITFIGKLNVRLYCCFVKHKCTSFNTLTGQFFVCHIHNVQLNKNVL